jgi:ATP-dependent RNA helicase DHX29
MDFSKSRWWNGSLLIHAEADEAEAKNSKNTSKRKCRTKFLAMAGGKKKKKPTPNPARGVATTSIASKPRADISEESASIKILSESDAAPAGKTGVGSISVSTSETENTPKKQPELSPEEFERQLEESELQTLVEKHSQKSKREAGRQIVRLQTDRRLLRSHADPLITRKWLPSDLIEEFLGFITEDDSLADNVTRQDKSPTPRAISEEDLTIRLWTLQQTLDGAGFPECKVRLALGHILGASDKIMNGNKDSIWGLEESLEWLARECSKDELSDYGSSQKKSQASKSQVGMFS